MPYKINKAIDILLLAEAVDKYVFNQQKNLQANLISYPSINRHFFMFKFDYVFFVLLCELNSRHFSPNKFSETLAKLEQELHSLIS